MRRLDFGSACARDTFLNRQGSRAKNFILAQGLEGGFGNGGDRDGFALGVEDFDGVAFGAVGRDMMVNGPDDVAAPEPDMVRAMCLELAEGELWASPDIPRLSHARAETLADPMFLWLRGHHPAFRSTVDKIEQRRGKLKRSVQTTLWFTDAEAHATFAKLLLDAKCVVPTDRRALTVTYSRQAEPLIKECLKKLGLQYALAVEDVET
jgi:hypothetical protein